EPIVQIERPGILSKDEEDTQRLIVELPGITDVEQAVAMIGETPVLEFMELKDTMTSEDLAKYEVAVTAFEEAQGSSSDGKNTEINPILIDGPYKQTRLTGRFLSSASLQFDKTTRQPYIQLDFNSEGADLFAEITGRNVGKTVAIFLDRQLGNIIPITAPVVQQEITGGQAVITGSFTPNEAKILVGRLNSGALPVDRLVLLSTQTIGPSLGAKAINAGINAGVWGLSLVAIFLIIWYRLPGLLAVISLGIYIAMVLALFKLIPVTLTAAGLAGFILSIGMAVDANVLIFERIKEEIIGGRGSLPEAIREGFKRAWLSIRDGNLSSIITAVILFWFGTSLIEGFALTFAIGIIISMFSAITITRTFLLAVAKDVDVNQAGFLFGSGIKK
ncbi:MAG TPA: protein translocase subunit SecD, partial [Candidatus Yonathbacteria bacterium]|nr:protein translocase subunit SecD [Candidatus Yonathbacteria bacterium]